MYGMNNIKFMMKLLVASHNFAKAPNKVPSFKYSFIIHYVVM
jgi:hypothetical protein